MGWRFRKRIKLFPGIHLNISSKGLGLNIGPKGANITFGPNGTYMNTGIPGTGLYRRDRVGGIASKASDTQEDYYNDDKEKYNRFVGTSFPMEDLSESFHKDVVLKTSSNIYNEDPDNCWEEISTPYEPRCGLPDYCFPTLDLLHKYDDSAKARFNDMEDYQSKMNRIVNILYSFGIQIHSIHATIGPTVTLYEITPAEGVRITVFRNLEDDLALHLCSAYVRIFAPIPGKGTVGIEVPNDKFSIVSMKSVLNSISFNETTMGLPCVIGKTITNEVFMIDLAKTPHLLIAGSSGQGKSVALNVIITSLLYKKHPAELKLVLMDPLGMEFEIYHPIINHFLVVLPGSEPIITNGYDAIKMLNSLCEEMNSRYQLFALAGVREIGDYNKAFIERKLNPSNGHKYMPYIVVVIDSYSALALGYEKQMIESLSKLTESARAVGIHLVISTNRPTSDIISSEIKAKFPARISFKMPEKIDSQVILDCNGAEELIRPGDMLYKNKQAMVRIQCAFVDTQETKRIVQHISQQQGYSGAFELSETNFDTNCDSYIVDEHDLDPLFEEAARHIVLTQQGSTSMIQRRFSIGYNRASRLMEQLEEAGIVGVDQGPHPREVLISDPCALDYLLSQLH